MSRNEPAFPFTQNERRGFWPTFGPYLGHWGGAAALWPISEGAHEMWASNPTSMPWVAVGMTLGTTALATVTAKATANKAPAVRLHSVLTTALGGAWVTASTIVGANHHPMVDLWMLGGAVAALSWNIRRWLKGTEKAASEQGEGEFFKAVKLARTKLRGELTVGPNKVVAPLQLPPGELTADDVVGAKARMASALSVSANSVRVAVDPDHHDRATVVVVPEDVLKTPTQWPGPSALGGSICEPLVLGLYEDGDPLNLWLPGDKQVLRNATHGLVMGMNGSGKTHGAKWVWTEILTRSDVVLWLADTVKGKQSVGPMMHAADWVEITQDGAQNMIDSLLPVIQARANYLGERGYDQWAPGCGIPYLVVWIEEAAPVVRDSETMIDIAQQARSAGLSVILSMQRPSYRNITIDVRQQLGAVWCFGVKSIKDAAFALSDELIDAGANPAAWANKRPGYSYLEAPGLSDEQMVKPSRTWDGNDEQMVAAIDAAAPYRAQLDPITAAAAGDAYANRQHSGGALVATAQRADQPPTTATGDDLDLLADAADLVIASQFGSSSMLQRKLRIGHEKADWLMGLLQAHGVVGLAAGDQPREVLVQPDQAAAVLDTIRATSPTTTVPARPTGTAPDPFRGRLADGEDTTQPADPEDPEPDLPGDMDTELPTGVPDMQIPRPKISPADARRHLSSVLDELRNAGLTEVGPKDVPDSFYAQVRSRPWVSSEMGRRADKGELIETDREGVYKFPVLINA